MLILHENFSRFLVFEMKRFKWNFHTKLAIAAIAPPSELSLTVYPKRG